MSHGQPKKPQAAEQEPTKYGDVYRVSSAVKDGHVLGGRVEPHAPVVPTGIGSAAIDGDPITIGEALEVVAISVGDKPVDQNDAAAISVAEIRATGEKKVRSGSVGETAQAAATLNSHVMRVQDMTKLSDILTDAAEKLSVDKAVTKEDAEAVYAAEVEFPWRRGAAEVVAEPGGVAASMATAANLNELK
ncbi:Late embryogenesis abundant protein 3, partial [Mucuna pruriens]